MATLKFTDLPIELRSLIFDKLTDPVGISSCPPFSAEGFISKNVYTKCLSNNLLHAAQVSPIFAKAVTRSIGPHVQYLSFRQTPRLWEWIPILNKQLKAIDFDGLCSLDSSPGMPLTTETLLYNEIRWDVQDHATFKTLEALYSNAIQLEKLNLSPVELFSRKAAKKMCIYMERVIQRNSSSLKEIHLAANQASVQAMKKVPLPNLTILHISTDICSETYEVPNSYPFNSEKAMAQILKAIHQNADHVSNISAVKELHLNWLCVFPKIKFKTCPRLFLGVKKLSLTFHYDSDQRAGAKFISNFKNLESLHWPANFQVISEVKNMEVIFAECPNLKDLTLARPSSWDDKIGIPQESLEMNAFFGSFRGQLQTVDFGYLTCEQIKILGEKNPNLEIIFLCIDNDNVEALTSLLGNHCRQLRELHLEYSKHSDHCFDNHSWYVLTNALQSASPLLNTISLIDGKEEHDRATEDMIDAVIDLLECMGDRAKEVRIKISMNATNPLAVLKGLWRTLKSASLHSKSIHNLCFDFFPSCACHLLQSQDDKDEINHWYNAVRELQKMLSTFKNVKEVDLGNIIAIHQFYNR